jgi:hypothetical protein
MERENYIDICTFEERRGIGWWKTGIWRLKGKRGMYALYAGRRESHPRM